MQGSQKHGPPSQHGLRACARNAHWRIQLWTGPWSSMWVLLLVTQCKLSGLKQPMITSHFPYNFLFIWKHILKLFFITLVLLPTNSQAIQSDELSSKLTSGTCPISVLFSPLLCFQVHTAKCLFRFHFLSFIAHLSEALVLAQVGNNSFFVYKQTRDTVN